ncbi:BREX-1 system phosphatase PglZ type A [Thalassotalea profundi]|uniref:DNA repair protein n=1 Tax=Thalassotalea profundi TaxID=2036687 RepID=A0ABQ3ICF7_9GAMM|nr:BREX-1 system phosphatase PglZ type A [Thalassotalea profundi]GHE78376.1 DNA repair protein [Thalassotalea profundi]
MNLEQIKQGILAKFDKCRLVFWQDEDVEFQEQLPEIETELKSTGVELIRLDEYSHFEIKQCVELKEPDTKFLLYSNKTLNEPTRDWLYDMRLYAEHFYADSSSMILNELGMRMEFRQDISRYKKFFGNQQRYSKLKKLLPEGADKQALELAMVAVVAKVESVSFTTILHQLISLFVESPNKCDEAIAELEKYDLTKIFWRHAVEEFGYIALGNWINDEDADMPVANVKDLITKLLVTDCYHGLQASGVSISKTDFATSLSAHVLPLTIDSESLDKLPKAIRELIGNAAAKRAAVVSFVSSWRESRTLSASYNDIVREVADELEIKHKLAEFKNPSNFINVETFIEVEQQLIKLIATDLQAYSANEISDWVSTKLYGHWCSVDKNYQYLFASLRAAKEFYDLRDKYFDGFYFDSAKALYKTYESELYKFDHAYRIFFENFINLRKNNGGDLLQSLGLVDDIENLYVNWYLNDLAIAWGKLVDSESLLDNWKIVGVHNQQHFYQQEVRGLLRNTQAKRIFVIISDALRYEVAHDIYQRISDEGRLKPELKSQLGVVPSYTQLGMGSLLPHQKLTAHLGSKVEYKADGISVHGHDNRQKVLSKHNGVAFKADEVFKWTRQTAKEQIGEAEVVYIYHDMIDAIGDKQSTENQTFEAAQDTVVELIELIKRIFNRLNGSRVLLTADHGFLFKMTDLTDSDKTAHKSKPKGAIEDKKRYVIGSNLPSDDFYWTGKIANTAGIDPALGDDAEFIVPRGSNRFNFVGGAKFIHGGIMPQEICVPVLQVRELDTKAQTKLAKQKVGAVPLQNPIKIVSNIDRISFLQTDPVGDKFKARKLELWIEDPFGKQVSSKEEHTFDSVSEKLDERKRNIQIKLEGSGFDRTISYKLIMEDTESKTKTTHSVIIDLAFEDDFF